MFFSAYKILYSLYFYYFSTFSNISECVDKKLYNCEPAEWNTVAKFRETFSSICFDDFQGTVIDYTNELVSSIQ